MATGFRPVADARSRSFDHPQVQAAWQVLDCGFAAVADVFEECIYEALTHFSKPQLDTYLDAARAIGKLGRGAEPLARLPRGMADRCRNSVSGDQEPLLPQVMGAIRAMQKSPNSKAITPFLQTLAGVARRLQSAEQLEVYIEIALDLMARTSGSIHGHHTTFPSPGLPHFFEQAPRLLGLLSTAGLKNWTDYGIRNYAGHPERQEEYLPPRFGRQPGGPAARTPRHPVFRRRASARPVPARAVAATANCWCPTTSTLLTTRPCASPTFLTHSILAGHARPPRRQWIGEGRRQRPRPLPRRTRPHGRPPALEQGTDRRQLEPFPAHGGGVLRGLPHRDLLMPRVPGLAPHLPGPAPAAA
jgi:hypothetical protein